MTSISKQLKTWKKINKFKAFKPYKTHNQLTVAVPTIYSYYYSVFTLSCHCQELIFCSQLVTTNHGSNQGTLALLKQSTNKDFDANRHQGQWTDSLVSSWVNTQKTFQPIELCSICWRE